MTNDRPLIIYHAHCMDGFTALWVFHRYFKGKIDSFGAKNGPEALKEIPDVTDRIVYIVDYCYPREVILEMKAKAKSLVVLDHHKTSQKNIEGIDGCHFDMNRSGASMAWDYCYPTKISNDGMRYRATRPVFLRYIEAQDLWKPFADDHDEVCTYMNTIEQTFTNWNRLSKLPAHIMARRGKPMVMVRDEYLGAIESMAYIGWLDGHVVPMVNCTFWNASYALNKLDQMRMPDGSWPKFAAGWFFGRQGEYKCSLRSSPDPDTGIAFDVSELAEKFSGGGHRQAAGFVVAEPAWKFLEAFPKKS